MSGILFIATLVLMLIGAPIAVSLGLGAASALYFVGNMNLLIVPQRMFGAMDSFPLMAIPFFILAGNLMAAGGISRRLIDFANTLVGRMHGGLTIVSILAGIFFAAISGSGAAATAALGTILIPSMVKKGYNREFSASVQACSGAIGIVIPPSVPLVLYGISGNVSIGDLFLGGFGPGLLIGIALIIVGYVISRKEGYGKEKPAAPKEVLIAFKDSLLGLLMPVIILGGIYGSIFTPTEAAVVAVVYGYVIGTFVYRELTWKKLQESLTSSVITTSIIMFIIGCAALFALVLTREQIPQDIAVWLLGISRNPLVILAIVNVFLLLVGMVMETAAAIIILTPILVPIIIALGINPVHFGVLMIVNLGIGLVTPPVGINLYVAANIAGTRMDLIIKKLWPFLIAMLVALILITYIPQITLWPLEMVKSLQK